MALATLADVETAIGRTLSGEESGRVGQLLETASAAVSAETGGFRFEPGSYTVQRRVRGGRVRLPAKVDSVTSVSSVNTDTGVTTPIAGWTLSGNTVYAVDACTAEIAFTVTAGVPASIVALVAGVATATMAGPAAGVESLGTGPFSVSFIDGSGRVWFSKTDKAILCGFRLPKPAIALL